LFGCSSRRRYSTRTLVSWRHFFIIIIFFSYRSGSALRGDVDASVVQQLAKHNNQKVTIASNRNSLFFSTPADFWFN
jgi:hypothetical protein